MNEACNKIFFLAPPPWAQGRGQKVEYHLISITKSISKIFIPNFVCVLTNERYKTYRALGEPRGSNKKKIQTLSCGISSRRG